MSGNRRAVVNSNTCDSLSDEDESSEGDEFLGGFESKGVARNKVEGHLVLYPPKQ